MRQALFPGNHADVADSLASVGVRYGNLGQYEESMEYYKQALEMRQALFPGNHADVATSLDSVGIAYGELGQYAEGLKYKKQALEMRQALFLTSKRWRCGKLSSPATMPA